MERSRAELTRNEVALKNLTASDGEAGYVLLLPSGRKRLTPYKKL